MPWPGDTDAPESGLVVFEPTPSFPFEAHGNCLATVLIKGGRVKM